MPTNRWSLRALSACALTMTSCASLTPMSAPPLPVEATTPCELYRLPVNPTEADLEVGYATRGSQVVICDLKRKLAVEAQRLPPRRKFLGVF